MTAIDHDSFWSISKLIKRLSTTYNLFASFSILPLRFYASKPLLSLALQLNRSL